MAGEPILAADIGGTKLRCGIVLDDRVVDSLTMPTPASNPAALIAALAEGLRDLSARARSRGIPVNRLGVASAGVIEPRTGMVTSATDAIVGWRGTDLVALLENATGLTVSVVNDVQAHALGEHAAGAARGVSDAVVIVIGTGIGGGVITDDRLVLGWQGAAGHLGHIWSPRAHGRRCSCGEEGHLEAVAGGWALPRILAERTGTLVAGSREVAVLAETDRGPLGDAAREVVDTAGAAVGEAVAAVAVVTDPRCVVISGHFAVPGTSWWSHAVAAHAHASRIGHPTELRAGILGPDAALIGAAAFAAGSAASRRPKEEHA